MCVKTHNFFFTCTVTPSILKSSDEMKYLTKYHMRKLHNGNIGFFFPLFCYPETHFSLKHHSDTAMKMKSLTDVCSSLLMSEARLTPCTFSPNQYTQIVSSPRFAKHRHILPPGLPYTRPEAKAASPDWTGARGNPEV